MNEIEKAFAGFPPLPDESKSRTSPDSFHVDYAVDGDNIEQDNLTHVYQVDDDALAELEQSEISWTCTFFDDDTETIQVFLSDSDDDMEWLLYHQISAKTAEQLSDMFAQIAMKSRERAALHQKQREEMAQIDAEIAARQGSLFKEEKQ